MPAKPAAPKRLAAALAVVLMLLPLGGARTADPAAAPPSMPAVDAPQLAALGPWAVGVESLTLVQPAQPEVLKFDPAAKALPLADRRAAPRRRRTPAP